MENYILKLNSGTEYKLYKGTTLVSDADLTTLFGVAGEMYLSFDFNSGTPSDLTTLTITDSSDIAVISNSNLTDTVAEGKNYKATWSNSATTFDTFEELEGKALDESQLSFLMGKIKDAGEIKKIELTSSVLNLNDRDTYSDGVYLVHNATNDVAYVTLYSSNVNGHGLIMSAGARTFAFITTVGTGGTYDKRYLFGISADNYSSRYRLAFAEKNRTPQGLEFIIRSDVPKVENLTTTDTNYYLGASQGKILADRIGDLTTLTTTDKTSAVAAINEVNSNLNDVAYVGDVLSTPSSVAYVATDNIQDGAVTSQKMDLSTMGYNSTNAVVIGSFVDSNNTSHTIYRKMYEFTDYTINTTDNYKQYQLDLANYTIVGSEVSLYRTDDAGVINTSGTDLAAIFTSSGNYVRIYYYGNAVQTNATVYLTVDYMD